MKRFSLPCPVGGFRGALSACLFFVFLFVFSFNVSVVSAQEAPSDSGEVKSLEDYLDKPPTQETLSPADAEKTQESSMLDRLQEAIMSVGDDNEPSPPPVEEDSRDALPNMQTRYKMRVEGFGERPDSIDNLRFGRSEMDVTAQAEEELAEEIRREAFDAAMTGLFPLRPDQIEALLLSYDKTKRATQKPVYGTPNPKVSVATLALDPGVPPMTLNTAVGYVSTLNILDVTGAPWPIQDIAWAGNFEVTEPEEGGHIIRIVPLAEAAYGNMSIRLLTLKTPITIMLKTNTEEVQYRVDARIPEYGPFAQAPLIEGGMERVAGNAVITSVLDGVAPESAKRLKVSGVDGRTTAYNINGMVYVRTPLSLLSPGWEQSVSSADGMNVYALNETPVLLLSDRGEFLRANLSSAGEL